MNCVLDRPFALGGHGWRSIRAQHRNWFVVLGNQDVFAALCPRQQGGKFVISLTRADGLHNRLPNVLRVHTFRHYATTRQATRASSVSGFESGINAHPTATKE